MRRSGIAIGVLLALLVAGLIVLRFRGAEPETPHPGEDAAPGSVQQAGETVGEDPNPPEAAAVAAVAMTGEVASAGFISRRELIESFSTPRFGPELADRTSEQMTALLLELSERDADLADLSVFEQPLRVLVKDASQTTATVDVWSVLVVAPPGAATARVMWRTVTVELVLVGQTWLVDGWGSTPGPTPMVGSESAISSADDIAEVLSWTPATQEVG